VDSKLDQVHLKEELLLLEELENSEIIITVYYLALLVQSLLVKTLFILRFDFGEKTELHIL